MRFWRYPEMRESQRKQNNRSTYSSTDCACVLRMPNWRYIVWVCCQKLKAPGHVLLGIHKRSTHPLKILQPPMKHIIMYYSSYDWLFPYWYIWRDYRRGGESYWNVMWVEMWCMRDWNVFIFWMPAWYRKVVDSDIFIQHCSARYEQGLQNLFGNCSSVQKEYMYMHGVNKM